MVVSAAALGPCTRCSVTIDTRVHLVWWTSGQYLYSSLLTPCRGKMSGLFCFFTTWGPGEYTTGKIMSGTSPARTHKCILNTTYKHPHKQFLIAKLSHLNIVFCIIIKSFIFHFTHINRYIRLLPNTSLKLIYILTSDHGAQNIVVRTT